MIKVEINIHLVHFRNTFYFFLQLCTFFTWINACVCFLMLIYWKITSAGDIISMFVNITRKKTIVLHLPRIRIQFFIILFKVVGSILYIICRCTLFYSCHLLLFEWVKNVKKYFILRSIFKFDRSAFCGKGDLLLK